MAEFTDEQKFNAGKVQMRQYLGEQYLEWHLVAVESIKKLILTSDEFYADMVDVDITDDTTGSPVLQ